METNFEDIKIIELNKNETHKSGNNTEMYDVVLNLSKPAPIEWAKIFNELWQSHLYMMKRKCSVSGQKLRIYCALDEIAQYHKFELEKVISETNKQYRQYLVDLKLEETKQSQKAALEKAKILNVKENLKF